MRPMQYRFPFVFAVFLAILTLLPLAPYAFAQTAVTGSLTGAVTDSSGAVVPSATVTIVNGATGDTRVVVTNAEGRYTAPFLRKISNESASRIPEAKCPFGRAAQ